MVPLDEAHKAIIEELGRSGFSTVWVSDYHLLQTHTKALQNLIDDHDKRSALKLKGFFKTISEGKDPVTCNCFCFPLDNGAWRVYRFSPGTAEAETWEQDGNGWTNCFFNKPADLNLAARAGGGKVHLRDDYPGECYPADMLWAVAAIQRAARLDGVRHDDLAKNLMAAFDGPLKAPEGLPAFQAESRSGRIMQGARGCGNSGILLYASELDPVIAGHWYEAYEKNFWKDILHLVRDSECSSPDPTSQGTKCHRRASKWDGCTGGNKEVELSIIVPLGGAVFGSLRNQPLGSR